jgi:hypothetical protein
VPASSVADVAAAVESARVAQRSWAQVPYAARADVVLRFHDLLVEHQDEVVDLIQWEMGKNRFSAWQEILQVATIARHYARHGATYLKDHKVRGAMPGLTQVREVRIPKGVIGMISPWNYPLYLAVGDVLPALLAGNGVVSRADSQTSLTLLWARDKMAESGLPTDLWHIVVGPGPTIGGAIIETTSASPAPPRPGAASAPRPADASSPRASSSAARTRSSSAPTPTWPRPRPAASPRPSPTPGRCASTSRGCWCTRRSTSRSRRCWSRACGR